VARGPNVFSGYLNLPEETASVFTSDGWFRTGDLGAIDSDGYVHVAGRASTLIVLEGGENVQPDELEEAYATSPVIRELGVLQHEGRLAALIVPEPRAIAPEGGASDPASWLPAVRAAVAERAADLPSYQRLAELVLTREALPRTRLGKLRRRELAQRFLSARQEPAGEARRRTAPMSLEELAGEDRAMLDNPAARRVWDWLAARHPEAGLTPDASPALDLGIDSLEWLNVTLEIGRLTGVELDDAAIGSIESVRDLLRVVAEQQRSGEGQLGLRLQEHPEELLDERQRRWLAPLGPLQSLGATILFLVVRVLMRVLFRVQVRGQDNLPQEGACLITPNHTSYLDAFAIAAGLSRRDLRRTRWGGWTGAAFGNPLTRAVSRLAQAVPIDREGGIIASLAFGVAALKGGSRLVWFPEGTRSATGELAPFRPGAGLLLHQVGVPVVPVFIRGAYEALPRHRRWPRLRRITVEIGEPLDPRQLERDGSGPQPQDRIVDALRRHVAALGAKSS
jgi:long-chain acyl-CoA synthetase